ncbi:MAG: hypothetical protein JWO70_741 [Betaproteobacteria bacterium]|nr:hypothetical protein [Betaproteobacteria bacterium]
MRIGETVRTKSTTRFIDASFSSEYRPVQPWVMRPCAVTPVASMTSIAAPESERLPRCCRCQSVIEPSIALYWHIAAIVIRLVSAMGPIASGSKSLLLIRFSPGGQTPVLSCWGLSPVLNQGQTPKNRGQTLPKYPIARHQK